MQCTILLVIALLCLGLVHATACPKGPQVSLANGSTTATYKAIRTVQTRLSCDSQQQTQAAQVIYFTPQTTGLWSLRVQLANEDGVLEIRKSCSNQVLACNDDWDFDSVKVTGFDQILLEANQEYSVLLGAWETGRNIGDGNVLEIALGSLRSNEIPSPLLVDRSTPPPSANFVSEEEEEEEQNDNTLVIAAAGAAGGVVALVALVAFIVLRRRQHHEEDSQVTPVPTTYDDENPCPPRTPQTKQQYTGMY